MAYRHSRDVTQLVPTRRFKPSTATCLAQAASHTNAKRFACLADPLDATRSHRGARNSEVSRRGTVRAGARTGPGCAEL